MRAAITTALGLFGIVVGYIGLQRLAERFFTGKYRAETAAGAVILAFVVGLGWPRSDSTGVPAGQAAVADPAPAVATADPVAPPSVATIAPVDVGAACASARLTSAAGKGNLDTTTLRSGTFSAPLGPHTQIHGGDILVAQGWAANPDLKAPAASVCLVIDGKIVSGVPVLYGASRADVANSFKNAALTPTGFMISLPTSRVEPGRHRIAAAAVTPTGSAGLLLGGALIERASATRQ